MSKVLILGGTGMLGHCVTEYLNLLDMEVVATYRKQSKSFPVELKENCQWVSFDASCTHAKQDLSQLIIKIRPDWVINCIGAIKQKYASGDESQLIQLNAFFPWILADAIKKSPATRLLTVSTDCVFDGIRGGYEETDTPNAIDLYGRSKILGEILDRSHVLTIRTSIFGPELGGRGSGLFGWFMSSQNQVKGFTRVFFSGVTTLELSKRIADILSAEESLSGLYQVSGKAISKYNLLKMINEVWNRGIEIIPDSTSEINRSLSYAKLASKNGYEARDVKVQLEQLKAWCDRRDYGY